MAKISWFKALTLVGTLADSLTRASSDGTISVEDALDMAARISSAAGITIDEAGIWLTGEILGRLAGMAHDGVITISEIIEFARWLCGELGIRFDEQGVQVG